MNKQRKVLITITYNEMGIITDTKAEEVIQPETNCSEIPNSSDAVSRQAAIDAIEKMNIPEDMCVFEILSHIEVEIATLPTIQPEVLACGNGELVAKPEPQWIPVSERLPEDLSEVNVTWVNHNPEPYYEFTKDKPFTTTAVYYRGEWYWYSANCVDNLAEYGRCDWDKVSDVIEIIAWMPLPEPYNPNKKQSGKEGV